VIGVASGRFLELLVRKQLPELAKVFLCFLHCSASVLEILKRIPLFSCTRWLDPSDGFED
jgi:hypothetical protein